MAGFEELIRGTLEKQGDPTAERRATIYESSRQALERMLSQNTELDDTVRKTQRERLEKAISDVEKDYVAKNKEQSSAAAPAVSSSVTSPPPPVSATPATPPAAPPATAPAPSPAPPAKQSAPPAGKDAASATSRPKPAPMPKPAAPDKVEAPQQISAASVAPPVAPAPVATPAPAVQTGSGKVEPPLHLEPEIAEDAVSTNIEDYPDHYRGNAFQNRKPYAKLLLWTIILVGLGVTIWWIVTFGPAFLQRQFDGSVPNPPSTIESGSFVPGDSDGWVSAFNPKEDGQNVITAGRGTADLIQDGDNMFVRIASNSGSTQNNLRIKMPAGVMKEIKGRSATFELMIKSPGDSEHQFAVFCEFKAMGNCGRKRFRAKPKVEAFIFDALINDVDLPNSEEAYIDINTDLSNEGKAVDLYSVRVRPG